VKTHGIDATLYTVSRDADQWHLSYLWRANGATYVVSEHVAPPFSFPDAAAHGLPHRTEHTYHVEFDARELWADAAGPNETIVVDLWDGYLEGA